LMRVLSYFSFVFEKGGFNSYSYWDTEYLFLAVFISFSLILTFILFGVSFYLSTKSISFEKGSSYECGFEPFGGAHSIFNIQYFIVGILFMIFDLEVAYLFAWALHLGSLPWFSFWVVIGFLVLLIIGFVYEWKQGALDWV